MKEIILKISEENDGLQIKQVLKKELQLSNKIMTKLKTFPDGIVLNGKKAYVTAKVSYKDELILHLYDNKSETIVPSDISIDIIYEDEDILALNKPRNMPTHPSRNHYTDTLANGVMNYYKDSNFTFRVITRLDRDTSGIVIIAKNKYSAQMLSSQMIDNSFKKEYYAICHNSLDEKKGNIDAPISRVADSGILREVNPDGKKALTLYEVSEEKKDLFLVKLIPVTGRTHQLRVHLSYMGCPIVGDNLYGSSEENEKTLLHCKKVTFIHPVSKKEITLTTELPDDMKKYLIKSMPL